MASATKGTKELFILTTLSIWFSLVYSVLNVEELNSVQYGFEILNEPVLVKEASDVGNTLVLSSKHGQRYQCTLPEFVSSENLAEQTQSISNDEIAQLFEPMKRKCLYNNKGWWTYEVCLGKGIYQYHEEGRQIIGEKISLGVFSSETDWSQKKIDSKVNKKPGKSTKVKQFHSQFYINGSKCDLTGKPRETQIKFFCEEGSSDVVARVDEPSSCSYIITVNTNKLCHYSLFKSTPTHTEKSITCSPALSEERFKVYIDAIESRRKAKDESLAKARDVLRENEIESYKKEGEMEKSAVNEQEKEGEKKRTSRRSRVWPWEEPGVESGDELWIDGNIGRDQIGVRRLDVTKGRRRGAVDDGDFITVRSQKLRRDRLPSSQKGSEQEGIRKEDPQSKRNKVEDDEKREVQRGKLDQDDKPAVVKEEDRQRDESFDHKSEEGNKETKLSEGTASSTDTKQDDNDAVFGEPDLEENWKTNMQKTVLKMRAALKDKLVKLGFQPEVLDKTFKEKLGNVIAGESGANDVDVDSENPADSVTKDETGDELIDKENELGMSTIQDTLLEDLKLLSNVLTKDLMVSIVKAAKAGQDALDEQLAKERDQLRKEIELARTTIKEVEETEEMAGVKDDKRGKTIVMIKEAIEQFEKRSIQLDSDVVAFEELNKEILTVVQDETNSEKSDFKKNLVELSVKANKLVRRIILASFQIEQDVLSIKKMRQEITTHRGRDGKSEKGAKRSQIDDLTGGMDLVISKLTAMIQNAESGELSGKEDGRAADDTVTGEEPPLDQRNAGVETPESPAETGVTDDEEDSGSRVKVRVSKVRKIDNDEESGLNEEGEFDEEEMEELGINEKLKQATKKMEELVKQQLKDSGVSPAAKIKVKIVTSKEALKNLDGKSEMKLLSEREENQFTEMIMNLLGGNLEAGKERRRQENLETNYNLVWNEDKLQSVAQEKEDSDSELEVEAL